MTGRKHPSSQSLKFRKASDEDLASIKTWLSEESRNDQTHSFIGNWDTIEKYHRSGSLLVCLEPTQKQPVAFQAGVTANPEIFLVRKEWRRMGIGESLFNHYIKNVLPKNQPIVVIECSPVSSTRFWKRMGFKVWTAQNGLTYGRLLIEPSRKLPKARPTVQIQIKALFSYGGQYDMIARRKAAISASGSIALEKRVTLFDPQSPYFKTPFLEIFAGKKLIFNGKATSPQAIQLGVERCKNGFFIDKLHPQKLPSNPST